MPDPLLPFPLGELRQLGGPRRWSVDQPISGLDSLTPVQGHLQAIHHGTALELIGAAETIVTLRCDRCLQHFNHALSAEVHELVELRGQAADVPQAAAAAGSSGDGPAFSLELLHAGLDSSDDLDDRLDPAGSFDPEHWLFEQLSLRLPLVNRCGDDCPGPDRWCSEPAGGDPRWAALARLGVGGASDPELTDSR